MMCSSMIHPLRGGGGGAFVFGYMGPVHRLKKTEAAYFLCSPLSIMCRVRRAKLAFPRDISVRDATFRGWTHRPRDVTSENFRLGTHPQRILQYDDSCFSIFYSMWYSLMFTFFINIKQYLLFLQSFCVV